MSRKTRAKRLETVSDEDEQGETELQVKVKTRAASTVERSQPTKKELAKQKRELDLFNKYKEQAKQHLVSTRVRQKVQEEKEEPEKPQKKQLVKGVAAVDEHVQNGNSLHVLHVDGRIYDCLMNQTNIIGGRNNNKFYVVQVLESDADPKKYYFFTRWGRVGVRGQVAQMGPWTMEECIHQYTAKIKEKSVKGDYRVIEKDYLPPQNELEQQVEDDEGASTLEPHLKELIKLIFDMKMMNRQMIEIGYDPERLPLGKIGQKAIQQGYKILEQMVVEIKKKPKSQAQLEILTSDFYSHIPHDFGFSKAPIIKTLNDVKDKLEMLASLEQIQIAARLIEKVPLQGNVIDSNYTKLNSNIEYVAPDTDQYVLLYKYLHNTHGSTHSNYQLQILDIYRVQKDIDDQRFRSDIGNRWLLWHGSRLTNFVGILSQGLRIAPPEAPVTGYMFGKGVYFADMVSKSANYCGTSKANPVGCILLCDVALGKWNDKFEADYHADELPPGMHSTRGCGRTAPPPQTYETFEGMTVPVGKGAPTQVDKTSLLYNEYIVYDVAQVRLKYILKVRFDYQ